MEAESQTKFQTGFTIQHKQPHTRYERDSAGITAKGILPTKRLRAFYQQ